MTRCLSRRRRRVNTAVRLNSGRRRAGGTFFCIHRKRRRRRRRGECSVCAHPLVSHPSSLHLARGFLFFFADSFRGRPSRAKRAVGRSIEGWEDANELEIILFVDSPRFIASTPRRCARRDRRRVGIFSSVRQRQRARRMTNRAFSHRRRPRRRRRRRRGAGERASASNDE